MQLNRVLSNKCTAVSEIEYFLFLQELTQAITIAQYEYDNKRWKLNESSAQLRQKIEAAENNRDEAIAQLSRFEVVPVSPGNGIKKLFTNESFRQWFKFWEDYFDSFTDWQTNMLQKEIVNQVSLTRWHPTGSWKDIVLQ